MEPIFPSLLVRKFENKAPRGRALDLGSGQGNDALFLAQRGFSVTAVEIRKDMAEIIKERAEENQLKVDVVQQDIRDFSIAENSVVFISAMNCLHYFLKQEFLDIIEKIKRGLVKGGIAVIGLFTTEDPMFEKAKAEMIVQDGGGFRDDKGRKLYFPKPHELKKIFEKDFEVLFILKRSLQTRVM